MSNLRSASTGGAALGPDVFRFFHAMGVPLKQIYGQTEIADQLHPPRGIAFHTVGEPIPETELRISEEGEILSRSPSVFLGYYKNEGDARGARRRLAPLRRRRLSRRRRPARRRRSPEGRDAALGRDPLLAAVHREPAQVLALREGGRRLGKDRPYLTAMLCIDMGVVGKWAERSKLAIHDLHRPKPEVYDLMQRAVDEVNGTPPAPPASTSSCCSTRSSTPTTRSSRARARCGALFVEERYRDVVAALYGDVPEVRVDTTIRFQDGKTSHIRTTLLVRQLDLGRAA